MAFTSRPYADDTDLARSSEVFHRDVESDQYRHADEAE